MAMTNYASKLVHTGYCNGNTAAPIKVYVAYKSSQDTANNRSTLYCGMYVVVPSGHTIGPWTDHNGSYVGATGNTFEGSIPNISGTRWLAENLTFTVNHNDAGSATATIYWKWGVNSPWGKVQNPSGSFTITLPTIARLSTVAASKGTLGAEQTLTVTRQSSAYTHAITYTCGSATGTVYEKGSATSIKWAPGLNLAAQNPNGNSVSINLTITTYNGTTPIGSLTTTFQATIPDTVKPTATLSISDPTGHKDTYGGFVQSKSKLEIKLTGKGDQGSTIKSYQLKVGSATYNANSHTAELRYADSVAIVGTVTDSRTRTGSADAKVDVLAYTLPKINSIAVTRCAADGTAKADGAFAKVTFTARITALNNKNSAAYAIEYRRERESSWSTVVATGAAGKYSPSVVAVVFPAAADSAFEVRVVASDDFGTVRSGSRTVPVAFALLQGDVTGTGLAIGQMATEPGVFAVGMPTKIKPAEAEYALDVAGDVRFRNVHGRVYGLGKAQSQIPSGADLNNYLEFGVYAVASNVVAEAVANCPSKYAGTLAVASSNGSGDYAGNYVYLLQTYRTYDGLYEYTRSISTDNTGAYKYSAWQCKSSTGWFSLGLSGSVTAANSDHGRAGKGCFYRVDDEKHVYVAFCCGLTYSGSNIKINATPLPEKYRPPRPIYSLCSAGGRTVSRVCINSSGEIYVEWVQDLSGTGATASFTLGWIDGYMDFWTS